MFPCQGLFQKKTAIVFKTRLSLKEKTEGCSMYPRCENAAGGPRDANFYSVSFSSHNIKFSIITEFK